MSDPRVPVAATSPLPQIVGLDVARFLSALLVASFHLGCWSWAQPGSSTARAMAHAASFPEIFSFCWFGWVGVGVFFILSGFVIAYSAHGAKPFKFVRSRVVRLYPAVVICALITVSVNLIWSDYSFDALLAQYLRTVCFAQSGQLVDGVYWTLQVEVIFYALIFFLLCLGRPVLIAGIIGAIGTGSSLYWLWLALIRPQTFVAEIPFFHSNIVLFLQYGCFFALGVFLWLTLCDRVSRVRLAVAGLCAAGCIVETAHEAILMVGYLKREADIAVPCAIVLVAILAMIVSVLANPWLVRQAGRRVLWYRRLGLATFPLYLLHNIVGATTVRLGIELGAPSYLALAVAGSLMVALSLLIATTVEPLLQGVLRQWLDRFGQAVQALQLFRRFRQAL